MARDTVIVLHNGSPYGGWKSVESTHSFEEAAGEAKLVISEQPGNPLPMKLGDDVVIIYGSTPVITGYVKGIDGSNDWGSHDINITVMDNTRFMIDSKLGPGVNHQSPISPKKLVEDTLSKMGLSKIGVVDKIGAPDFGPGEQITGAIDEGGHEFLDKWLNKRQLVMHPDGKGNVVLDRNQQRTGPGTLYRGREDSPQNNVLRSSYQITDEGRHNSANAAAQHSPNDKPYWEDRPKGDPPAQSGPLSTKWGEAIDEDVRPERKLYYRAERGLNDDSPKKAAVWRSNVARARGYSYAATVQGFEAAPGELWWPGVVIPVYDYAWEISELLFIKSVTFRKDWGGGSITEISCTYKDGYSNQEGGAPKSRTGSHGTGSP
ncbi:MAG: hypothetical protein RIC14_05695 [Filomicrobium sp.]